MLTFSFPLQWPTPPPAVEYPIDGGRILCISGKIRETACEALFEQDNEEKSIATLILDSILKVGTVGGCLCLVLRLNFQICRACQNSFSVEQ